MWVNGLMNFGRVALLILLGVAIFGPWFYETMYTDAPPEGPCPTPLVRVEYGRCAMRMPGTTLLAMMAGGFFGILAGAVTGTVDLASRLREFLGCALVFVLVLPFVSTLLVALRKDSRLLRGFHVVACGLAAILVMLMLVFVPGLGPIHFWGVWLYLAGALVGLGLEIFGLVVKEIHPSPQS